MILTEERDTARAQEEELFEKLTERTNDLDRLRESYVEITDRWNDAQDEGMDLKDKIEALESALESKNFLQTTMSGIHSSTAMYATPSASISTDSVAKLYAHPPRGDAESRTSPRGSKTTQPSSQPSSQAGAKVVTPGKPDRATKTSSPRGHSTSAGAASTAEGKSRATANGESLPTTGRGDGSPRKPPPAPVAAASGDYDNEYYDEYDEEFEED